MNGWEYLLSNTTDEPHDVVEMKVQSIYSAYSLFQGDLQKFTLSPK